MEDNQKFYSEVEYNALVEQCEEYRRKLESLEQDFAGRMAERDFNELLNHAATHFKAHDLRAVLPFLDLDSLKNSPSQEADINAAFLKLKDEKPFLFVCDEPFFSPVAPSGNADFSQDNAETFAKMGYLERLALKRSDPDKYKFLKSIK